MILAPITYVAAYLAALAAFVALDMVWLGIMAPRLYRPMLGDMALAAVNLPPAVVFYALIPAGLVIFAVNPALKSGSLASAVVHGALFGFFTYATYDLTNHATLRNWTMSLTVIDIALGCRLAGLAAAASFLAARLVSGDAA